MSDLIFECSSRGSIYTKRRCRNRQRGVQATETGSKIYEIYEGSADAVLEPSRLQFVSWHSTGRLHNFLSITYGRNFAG